MTSSHLNSHSQASALHSRARSLCSRFFNFITHPLPPWKQEYFFYVHLVTFILVGFFSGLILFLSELNSSWGDLSFLDAIYTSYSALCITGLLTIDFSLLNPFSQIVTLMCIIFGGATISPIWGLLFKIAQSYQRMNFSRKWAKTHNYFATSREQKRGLLVRIKQLLGFGKIPVTDYEFLSLVMLLIVICALIICLVGPVFLFLGVWFQVRYQTGLSGNNPWWVALFLSCSAFNNAGITPFATNLMRFATDFYVSLFLVVLIVSGNTLFPAILRTAVSILYHVFQKRSNGPLFHYILQHHHRLSIHLFPLLQTQIYVFVTFVLQAFATFISFVSEYNDVPELTHYPIHVRLLISFFHSVSTRSAGFNTVDLSKFGLSTLLLYVVMMRIKPQMFCALNEEAYGVETVIERIRILEGTEENPNNKASQVESEDLLPDESSSKRKSLNSDKKRRRMPRNASTRNFASSKWRSSLPAGGITPTSSRAKQTQKRRRSFSDMSKLSTSGNTETKKEHSPNGSPTSPKLFVTVPDAPHSASADLGHSTGGNSRNISTTPDSAKPLVHHDTQKQEQLRAMDRGTSGGISYSSDNSSIGSGETSTAGAPSFSRNSSYDRDVNLLANKDYETVSDSADKDLEAEEASAIESATLKHRPQELPRGKSMDFILENKKKAVSSIPRSNTITFGNISQPMRDTFSRMARRGLFGTPLHYLYAESSGEPLPFKKKLFLVWNAFFTRLKYHFHSIFVANNLWLFVFCFLICFAEQKEIRDNPANFNFFKILFEVISAYGNVGLSLGWPGSVASFSVAFSPFSKILIILTMIIGRHRGMKKSTKEQNFESKLPRSVADYRPSRDIAILQRRREDEGEADEGPLSSHHDDDLLHIETSPVLRSSQSTERSLKGKRVKSVISMDTLHLDDVTV